jgi:hypothetical protein
VRKGKFIQGILRQVFVSIRIEGPVVCFVLGAGAQPSDPLSCLLH